MKLSVSEHRNIFVTKREMSEGEEVPLHDHSARVESQHVTICASGSIRCEFPDGRTKDLVAGDLYDFADDEQAHRIIATSDGTVFFNIAKTVPPEEQ